jgi:hypothetical protein
MLPRNGEARNRGVLRVTKTATPLQRSLRVGIANVDWRHTTDVICATHCSDKRARSLQIA